MIDEFAELKEKVKHGDFMLPFVAYEGKMPEHFTSFPMHWHKEMEIVLVRKGIYEINIDLEKYLVEEGDIILLKPCTLHSFCQYEHKITRMESILFDMELLYWNVADACYVNYFKPFLEERFSYPVIIRKEEESYETLLGILESLLQIYKKKAAFFELEIKSQLFLLFSVLFQKVFEKKANGVKNEAIENMKEVLDYIGEHYQRTISVGELADVLHFSEQYFMRFFKKNTGMTCVDYMNDLRLRKATDLLATTELSVMEISLKVGMNNVSYFNRKFKEKFQMTPKEYRRKSRGEVAG